MTIHPKAPIRPLLLYINENKRLQSLLYDMDLLPEQCEEGTRDHRNMLLLTVAWKAETERLTRQV